MRYFITVFWSVFLESNHPSSKTRFLHFMNVCADFEIAMSNMHKENVSKKTGIGKQNYR